MLIKYFYDDLLAQASYLVACQATNTAVVIDPSRDIQAYLKTAEENDFSIQYVTETHIHADFVSGTRELAHATGATMLLSGEGGAGWQYNFSDKNVQLVHEGDEFWLGNVKLQVWHTPGHTPEHIIFMLTDTAAADDAMGLFTGDCLFVGDVGRPDLLEEAAGQAGTRQLGAQQQYANVQRLKELPDYLQVWPGHGAGSACGKALGSVPSSTLGYEKRFNPAFQQKTTAEFVAWLLDGQPEAPRYFAQMKHINKVGPALLKDLPAAEHLSGQRHLSNGTSPQQHLIIDVRPAEDFARKHVPGTVNIPLNSGGFNTYVGWYVDFDAPSYFIAYEEQVADALRALRAIGVDNVPGYYTAEVVEAAEGAIVQKTAQEIYDAGIKILDVRGLSEYQAQHIPGAMHLHMGKVPQHLDQIPRDEPLAIQCGGGLRSQVVASILQKHGYTNVVNLAGGIGAWQQAKLPIEEA